MGAYRIPATAGNEHDETIDAGTSARVRMPSPGPQRDHDRQSASESKPSTFDAPWVGALPASAGIASVSRIPIPGTAGLCIELRSRGWTPQGGSTSTLFFQDVTGKRHLRLDYGFNVKTNSINYHWNQAGTHANFGIADHTPLGRGGAVLHQSAKYFSYAGRVLLVAGVAIDAVSIVRADRPLRRASQVVAGWAAAAIGCRLVGAGGAAVGLLASPIGSAIGGFAGCIVGGFGAYYGASVTAGDVFDWAETTSFNALPEVVPP